MTFFKATRDQLKANAFVSHVEFAVQQFRPPDMIRCEHHLRGAQKALVAFQQAKGEYILSVEGWDYVAGLAAQLEEQLSEHRFDDLARDAQQIATFAYEIVIDRTSGKH